MTHFFDCRCALYGGMLLSLVLSRQATASIVPTSQSRYVSSSAYGTNATSPSSKFTAPDYGPFDANSTSNTVKINQYEFGYGSAQAVQKSSITTTSITASGGTSVGGGGLQGNTGGGIADSFFDVFFNLTQPSTVSLSGTTNQYAGFGAPGSVVFFGPGGQITTSPPLGGPFSYSALLAAGQYELKAISASNGGEFSPGVSSFNFTFNAVAVPEPSTLCFASLGFAGLLLAVRRRVRRRRAFPLTVG